MLVDNKIIKGTGTEQFDKALKILFPNCNYRAHNAYMAPGFSFGAKESCLLVQIKFETGTQLSKEQVEHAFNRADLYIEYECFYGDTFVFETNLVKKTNKTIMKGHKKLGLRNFVPNYSQAFVRPIWWRYM